MLRKFLPFLVLSLLLSSCSSIYKGTHMPLNAKINYLEFAVKNLEATKKFFITVFDWSFTDYGPGPEYSDTQDSGIPIGLYKADLATTQEKNGSLPIFVTNDLEEALEKVKAAGGVIVKPTFSFPGGKRFQFLEPSGNEFGMAQLDE